MHLNKHGNFAMHSMERLFSIDITPQTMEGGQEGLLLKFGDGGGATLFLDSPQARALASSLIERAYRLDVKSKLKPLSLNGS